MTGRSGVSVALASYNGERFIGHQLESIASQVLPPDEVVLSDGGSSDRTVEIATAFFAAHPVLNGRVIADGARLGVTPNFERAILATTGRLIALSDQDDVWTPDRLRLAAAAFDEHDVLVVHSDARLVDLEGAPLGLRLYEALGVHDAELSALAGPTAFATLIRRNLVTGATAMIRRDLLDVAVPFPASWVHDEWLAMIAAATGRLLPLRDELIDYRQHGGNEIGVVASTLRYRLGRMVQPRGQHYRRLAVRAAELSARLESLDVDVDAVWRELAFRKQRFEERRAAYPRHRIARLAPVLRNTGGRSYSTMSSQGRLDIVRDLVQPS